MDAPPSYAAQTPNLGDEPPAYAFPQSFPIGRHYTKVPLVTSSQLKGHLTLLSAFANLRSRIEDTILPNDVPTDVERRWIWFVGVAVNRFSVWCHSLEEIDVTCNVEDVAPPLDVLMVWHAYMLNPRWYAEDCIRIPVLSHLSRLGEKFVALLTSPNLYTFLEYPSEPRVSLWEKKTARIFDPLQDVVKTRTTNITCPKCDATVAVSYLNHDGTGYLQEKFHVGCPACFFSINKRDLAMRKLAQDLIREGEGKRDYLAGTLHHPHNSSDEARAKLMKDSFLNFPVLRKPKPSATDREWAASIVSATHANGSLLWAHILLTNRGEQFRRVYLAYQTDYLFSVDLVGAVVRQGGFVKKMHDLHWTEPGFFDGPEDEIALQHAIARYHAFLDLMTSSPLGFFVPTLDIDLAWHTHQLMGPQYEMDCFTYIERFIDHDDKVEESKLSSAFDITCRAWKDRFGVQYTHCGCPLPGETIGQKLARLVSHNSPTSYLVPPPRDDLLSATHPSDHNSIHTYRHSRLGALLSRKRYQEKIKKRQQREARAARRSHVPQRSCLHSAPFLIPVPLYFTAFAAGCVGFVGNIDSGPGGGGACAAGACGSGGACGSSGGSGGCGGGGSGGGGSSGDGGGSSGGGGGCGGGGCGGGGGGGGGCGGG